MRNSADSVESNGKPSEPTPGLREQAKDFTADPPISGQAMVVQKKENVLYSRSAP